jgi:(p)ppGpp synthase/HD superfamily hydrolase
MTVQRDDRREFEAIVAELHTNHPRDDQFEHCRQVAGLLEQALERDGIHWPANRDMILAALGHDLYEDVKPKPVQCVSKYGAGVHDLISAVTEDDQLGVSEYIERVATGPEEAVLIKLCDGISNYGGLVDKKKLDDDAEGKLRKTVDQKMEPMFTRLEGYKFSLFPKAGKLLSGRLRHERQRYNAYAQSALQT